MESSIKAGTGGRRIKAVLFDFDGVLTTDKTGSTTTLRYLSQRAGVEINRLSAAFKEYNDALNLGRVTHSSIWPTICHKLNCHIDIRLLPGAFESTPFNEGMLQLARNLRQRYFVGIVTDNKADRMDHLKVYAGLSRLFEPIIVSSEVGSDKSSSAIFERALRHLAIAPHESVFIDNSKSNLIAPAALGMKTIYFDDEEHDLDRLIATLEKDHGVTAASGA